MRVNQVNTRNYQNRQSFKQLKPISKDVKAILTTKVFNGDLSFAEKFAELVAKIKTCNRIMIILRQN